MHHDPTVSVSVLTYNQEDWIGRALDSVLMQRTDFPVEIIVGDDYSTDGTREVLRDYAARYPDRITLILHPRRYTNEVPGRTNNTTNLLNCRGRYTAMLDGDDYWTDPLKLQKQHDLLEAHPGAVLCLHNSTIDYVSGRIPGAPRTTMEYGQLRSSGFYTHADIAQHRRLTAQVGTAFFHTRVFGEFPDWFYEVVPADYALQLLVSRCGAVYYDTTPMASYTVSNRGFVEAYSRDYALTLRRLADTALFAREFPATTRTDGHERGNAYLYYRLLKHTLRRGQLREAGRHARDLFTRQPTYVLHAAYDRVANFF